MGTVLVYPQQNLVPRRPLLHRSSQNQNLSLKTQTFSPKKSGFCLKNQDLPSQTRIVPSKSLNFPQTPKFLLKKKFPEFSNISLLLFLQTQNSSPQNHEFFSSKLIIIRTFPSKTWLFPSSHDFFLINPGFSPTLPPRSKLFSPNPEWNTQNSLIPTIPLIFLPTRGFKQTPNSTFPPFFFPQNLDFSYSNPDPEAARMRFYPNFLAFLDTRNPP